MVVGGWVRVEEIGDKVSSFPRKASGFFFKEINSHTGGLPQAP